MKLKKKVIASLSSDAMANMIGGHLSQNVCQYSIEPCKPITGIICVPMSEKEGCTILSDENTVCEPLDPGKPTDGCGDRSINC